MPRRADEPETASNHIRPNRRTTTAPVRTRPGCDPSSPQCQRVVTAITPQISNPCEKSGLAAYPNVRVKISGACTLAREAFPYDDIWDPVLRIIDAFGIDRCMWGTDWTR